MKKIMTWLAIGMFCIAPASYAALPANTILDQTQKDATVTDTQTKDGDALKKILGGSTEPQDGDKKEKMVYSSLGLSDIQKIHELAKKYGIEINDTGLGYESVAKTAREALEAFLPHAPPSLKVINLYAGQGGGDAETMSGVINVGVVSQGRVTDFTKMIKSGSLPAVGCGDSPAEETMSTLFHESAHVVSMGELGGSFPHRIFELYYNVGVSDYAATNLHEREAEFCSLMFTRPDVMKAYCANYPSMKVAYDATKQFYESIGVKVPADRLMRPPNSPDWK